MMILLGPFRGPFKNDVLQKLQFSSPHPPLSKNFYHTSLDPHLPLIIDIIFEQPLRGNWGLKETRKPLLRLKFVWKIGPILNNFVSTLLSLEVVHFRGVAREVSKDIPLEKHFTWKMGSCLPTNTLLHITVPQIYSN